MSTVYNISALHRSQLSRLLSEEIGSEPDMDLLIQYVAEKRRDLKRNDKPFYDHRHSVAGYRGQGKYTLREICSAYIENMNGILLPLDALVFGFQKMALIKCIDFLVKNKYITTLPEIDDSTPMIIDKESELEKENLELKNTLKTYEDVNKLKQDLSSLLEAEKQKSRSLQSQLMQEKGLVLDGLQKYDEMERENLQLKNILKTYEEVNKFKQDLPSLLETEKQKSRSLQSQLMQEKGLVLDGLQKNRDLTTKLKKYEEMDREMDKLKYDLDNWKEISKTLANKNDELAREINDLRSQLQAMKNEDRPLTSTVSADPRSWVKLSDVPAPKLADLASTLASCESWRYIGLFYKDKNNHDISEDYLKSKYGYMPPLGLVNKLLNELKELGVTIDSLSDTLKQNLIGLVSISRDVKARKF
ncbi:Hypothetical protein ORPV_801 [Orpheovirus IHUMI-LCC2]|uniref:Uncharacterized protein n=1 Tax=Orpheovirus IHUMI-LCC2 TaxID=2023057 RepID=A0A2I2L573_9VIRU|nr:Hypothetical protein ORPV_801 [Orpheovirus IHUMI-LCC2]SNW62705.1 Hypothetical protein ORPV_801 [Orpheovirus IHUMI-LCC2]